MVQYLSIRVTLEPRSTITCLVLIFFVVIVVRKSFLRLNGIIAIKSYATILAISSNTRYYMDFVPPWLWPVPCPWSWRCPLTWPWRRYHSFASTRSPCPTWSTGPWSKTVRASWRRPDVAPPTIAGRRSRCRRSWFAGAAVGQLFPVGPHPWRSCMAGTFFETFCHV